MNLIYLIPIVRTYVSGAFLFVAMTAVRPIPILCVQTPIEQAGNEDLFPVHLLEDGQV